MRTPRSRIRLYCWEADGRTRTGDPFITSEVLYQLSYVGEIPANPIFSRAQSGPREASILPWYCTRPQEAMRTAGSCGTQCRRAPLAQMAGRDVEGSGIRPARQRVPRDRQWVSITCPPVAYGACSLGAPTASAWPIGPFGPDSTADAVDSRSVRPPPSSIAASAAEEYQDLRSPGPRPPTHSRWPIGPSPRTASTCRPRQSAPPPRPACSWRFSPPACSPADAC
jgi:hypothetical protein